MLRLRGVPHVALACAINISLVNGWLQFLSPETEYYDIPLKKVDSDPFLTYYTYPIKGNNLITNDTHIFLPIDVKLYSQFYMDMPYSGERFFGISQQSFAVQRAQIALEEMEPNLLANDHMAFIKSEGSWRDMKENGGVFEGVGYDELNFENSDIFTTLAFSRMYLRLVALFGWSQLAGLTTLTRSAGFIPAQVPLLKNIKYSEETERLAEKLRSEMSEFKSGITDKDYHNFDKSSFFCLHSNLEGIEATVKEGKPTGWWIPLKRNFLSWRGLVFQEPIAKFGTVAGVQSFNRNGDNLEVVFRGTQLYHFDWNGIDAENFVVQMGPPNKGVADTRPPSPEKPTSIQMQLLRATINNLLPSNNRLPWTPRQELCPDFENSFQNFKDNCEFATLEDGTASLDNLRCGNALANFYPCMSYYLRSSEKYSHGIDGIQEFAVVYHVMLEAPFDVFKGWANDKPWDDEFDTAMAIMFGH